VRCSVDCLGVLDCLVQAKGEREILQDDGLDDARGKETFVASLRHEALKMGLNFLELSINHQKAFVDRVELLVGSLERVKRGALQGDLIVAKFDCLLC
jgi:hypothetical protein